MSDTIPEIKIVRIEKTAFLKCPRCWRHDPTCGHHTRYKQRTWKELCYRCAEVVEAMYQRGELKERDRWLWANRASHGFFKPIFEYLQKRCAA